MGNYQTHCLDCLIKTHTYEPVDGGKVCTPCLELRKMKKRNEANDAEYRRILGVIVGKEIGGKK